MGAVAQEDDRPYRPPISSRPPRNVEVASARHSQLDPFFHSACCQARERLLRAARPRLGTVPTKQALAVDGLVPPRLRSTHKLAEVPAHRIASIPPHGVLIPAGSRRETWWPGVGGPGGVEGLQGERSLPGWRRGHPRGRFKRRPAPEVLQPPSTGVEREASASRAGAHRARAVSARGVERALCSASCPAAIR